MWFSFGEETTRESRERGRETFIVGSNAKFGFSSRFLSASGFQESRFEEQLKFRSRTKMDSVSWQFSRHLPSTTPLATCIWVPPQNTHSVYIQDLSFRVVANSLRRRNIFFPTEAKEAFRLSHEYNLRVLSREPNFRRKTLRAVCARCIFLYRLIRWAKAKNREVCLVCPSRVVFAKFTIKVVGDRVSLRRRLAATSSQEVFRKFLKYEFALIVQIDFPSSSLLIS